MYLPQRSSFCSAEIGSKVFAIFNLTLASVSSLATIGALIFCATNVILGIEDRPIRDGMDPVTAVLSSAFVMVVMMLSFVSFMFAVFLVNGVFTKKPEHMHAYFVYGVVVEVLSLLATFTYAYVSVEEDFWIPVTTFSICFIYGLILSMIRKSYRELQTLNQQYNHQPMIEKC